MRYLFFAAFAAALLTLVACTSSGESSQNTVIPSGTPGAQVDGTWTGTFSGRLQTGDVCFFIKQDGTSLTGYLSLDGSRRVYMVGTLEGGRLSLAYGNEATSRNPSATIEPGIAAAIGMYTPGFIALSNPPNYTTLSSGIFYGTASNDSMDGAWAAANSDRGDWTAKPSQGSCGAAPATATSTASG